MTIIKDGKLYRGISDECGSKKPFNIEPIDMQLMCAYLTFEDYRSVIDRNMHPLLLRCRTLRGLYVIFRHFEKNKALDMMAVLNELQNGDFWITATGVKLPYPERMAQLFNEVTVEMPRRVNEESMASIARERAIQYREQRMLDNIAAFGLEKAVDKDRELEIMFTVEDTEDIEVSMHRAMDDFIEFKMDYMKRGGQTIGYKCYDFMNELFGGLRQGEVSVIGARPSQGKSLWMLAMALELHRRSPESKPAILNLEMPRNQIIMRVMQNECDVTSKQIMDMDVSETMELLTKAISDTELHITEPLSKPFEDVIMVAEKLYDMGHRVFFIDYLQQVSVRNKRLDKHLVIEECLKMQKAFLAKRKEAHFVNLCQLKRTDKKIPDMSDLRWSSYIEECAAWVVFLYGEQDNEQIDLSNMADVWEEQFLSVGKNRHGPMGIFKYYRNRARQKVQENMPYGFSKPIKEDKEDLDESPF